MKFHELLHKARYKKVRPNQHSIFVFWPHCFNILHTFPNTFHVCFHTCPDCKSLCWIWDLYCTVLTVTLLILNVYQPFVPRHWVQWKSNSMGSSHSARFLCAEAGIHSIQKPGCYVTVAHLDTNCFCDISMSDRNVFTKHAVWAGSWVLSPALTGCTGLSQHSQQIQLENPLNRNLSNF